MDVTSVNSSVPTDRQTYSSEATEPKRTETNETTTQENREAYRVSISSEALRTQTTSNESPPAPPASPSEGSEAVQTYTRGAQIAG